MRTNVIIIDDFYSNPDAVRAFALQQDFTVKGNWPGQRTNSFMTDDTRTSIQNILRNAAGEVTAWNDSPGMTGSFEIATALNRSWIHTDHHNTWAGVCYLTPDAPYTGGTGLFRHRATGATMSHELAEYESHYSNCFLLQHNTKRYYALSYFRTPTHSQQQRIQCLCLHTESCQVW